MKKFGKDKIKLNQFSKDELDRRKMNALKGGCPCSTSCRGCGDVSFSAAYYRYNNAEGYAY